MAPMLVFESRTENSILSIAGLGCVPVSDTRRCFMKPLLNPSFFLGSKHARCAALPMKAVTNTILPGGFAVQ